MFHLQKEGNFIVANIKMQFTILGISVLALQIEHFNVFQASSLQPFFFFKLWWFELFSAICLHLELFLV